ncbi:MAG: PD40 domain-containing protein, partial [Vicinamibacteraceae bacterium]|nr:PD40 domain-containing protein [Vicinamibacteraceae bacterium]
MRRIAAGLAAGLTLCLGSPLTASAQPATLYRTPTANATHIVFAWAGDLWRVSRDGGDATRLTSGVGIERDPYFSPDGTKIAFTGQYDGNTDVFVVDAAGGVPTRLTWHPGTDDVAGWSPDGRRVLFASPRASHRNIPQLFTVGLDGGLPERVPLPIAERGAFSPDGRAIAYEPLYQWQPRWKRYRGGQTDKIWIAQLSDSSVTEIPRENSTDRYPMWVGERIYFLSDREGGRTALYAYDPASRAVTPAVVPGSFDILSASGWAGDRPAIVYEQFGTIHLYDIASGQSRAVDIRATGDMTTLRPRFQKVGDQLQAPGISPTGARALFQARGEIVTVPAEKGDARNLTNTPGVMERYPAWSPDGQSIAYFSDASGEYALHVRDQKGAGEVRTIALPPLFYYTPVWSPDSRKLAFMDKALTLWVVDAAGGTPVKVDTNPIGLRDDVLAPAWSPDSRWIAYARQLDNRLRAIFVYSVESGEARQVTDGLSDARHPVFDKGGQYLFFTASTNLGPGFSFAEMSTFPYLSSRNVYAAVLQNDVASPLAPESDEEKPAKSEADAKSGETDRDKAADKTADSAASAAKGGAKGGGAREGAPGNKAGADKVTPVRIDFDGLGQRIVALPFPSLDYVDVQVGKKGCVFAVESPVAGPGAAPGPPTYVVHKLDLEKRKVEKAIEGVSAFVVSANGEKALV